MSYDTASSSLVYMEFSVVDSVIISLLSVFFCLSFLYVHFLYCDYS